MKKFLLLLSVFALCTQGIDGKVVTAEQAMAVAKRFSASSRMMNASGSTDMRLSHVGMSLKGMNDYYVFNREGGQGFVIISGDDMTDRVLAYSDRGSFDLNQAPEAVKIMLERYQKSLALMRKNPEATRQARSLTMNPNGVSPMFLNEYGEGPHWHQFAPYNNYFPVYNGEHCYAGCVPIAFAHIMKGLQYPTYGNGSNTFHYMLGDEEKTATANFNHTYKYRNMKNGYSGTSTGWQDCAQMIYDIAVAFNAKFSTSSTNVSYDQIIKGMVAYFDYNPNVQFLQKQNYADATWREMVYTEIDEGRPVLYFGYRTVLNDGTQNAHVGHAFVMDGYDSEGRVRVIWGFQPEEYNSYFSFDLLSPRIYGDTPYEHDEYDEGFNADQYAIMGIRPAEEGENGGVVVTGTTYQQEVMPANDVRGSFEVKALSGPWQGTIRWALATKGTDGKYNVATSAYTSQVDLQENETDTIDISGSYYLTEGTQYYVVVWSPYFPNNYDWNWFFNDPIPFTVGNEAYPPEVTEKPVITVVDDPDAQTVTVTATGNGTVILYNDDVEVARGEGVATYVIPYTDDPEGEEMGFSATAQEEGKEVSEYALATVEVPGKPAEPIAITEVYVNGYEYPVGGESARAHLNLTVPEDANYSIYDVGSPAWYDANDNEFKGTFVAGETYALALTLEPNEGYYFADNCKFYVNGSTELVDNQNTYVDYVGHYYAYLWTKPQVASQPEPQFLLGDVDKDGSVTIADVTALIDYLLSGDATNIDLLAADTDEDDSVTIADVTTLIDMLLQM